MEETFTIQALLRDWQLPEDIILNFKENNIKIEQLSLLTESILRELCPQIGLRIELKNKIDEYLTSTATTATGSSISTNVDDDDLNYLQDIISTDLNARPEFPDFDLRTLLTITPCGNSILNFYSKTNILTNKHRNQLTDIIIRHLFTRIINHKITYEEYNILTAKIISIFPSENTGTYFVPPIKKRESISGKPSFAKGKLIDKVRNTLYKSGERKRKVTDIETCLKKKKYEELTEDHTDALFFLKNNTEPWSAVIEYWIKTFDIRRNSDHNNVAAFIEEWEILNDPRSDALINLDFDKLYPERSASFIKNWKWFINKVISVKYGEAKDDTLSSIYESVMQQPNDDQKVPEEIKLLCYLIPPKGRLNKHRKFSTLECIENFLIEVQNPGDIESKIEEVKKKAALNKLSVQPYLIRCVANASEASFYLVIDKIKYQFKSPIKAFDTLFKSYHALHAMYPPAAAHLYLLIQRCVYNIKTIHDKPVPYITDLLSLTKPQ